MFWLYYVAPFYDSRYPAKEKSALDLNFVVVEYKMVP